MAAFPKNPPYMKPFFFNRFRPNPLRRAGLLPGAACLLALPFLISTAQAATWTWDSNGATSGVTQASGTWNTSNSNWWNGNGNVVWNNDSVPPNVAQFGNNTGPTNINSRTVTVSGTVKASSLLFNRGDGTTATPQYGYILTGGTIELTNGIELVARANTGEDRRHRIDSVISGNNLSITRSSLTNSNLAMLRLGGNNTWTGTLTLSSGSASGLFVEAMNGASLNSLDSVNVGTNSTLVLASSDEFTKGFSIAGTGAESRGAIRFDVDGGSISGAVTLTDNASIRSLASNVLGTVSGNIGETGGARTLSITLGAIVLSGTNTHSGGTTLTSGTLHINNASALGTGTFTITGGALNNSSGSSITVAGNAQAWNANFSFAGTDALNLGTGAVTLGGSAGSRTVTVTANTLTVGGIISDGTATGLTKAGAGTLVLSGHNTYTGTTAVNAGTLVFTGGSTGGGNVTVANGATLNIRGNYTIGTAATSVTLSAGAGSAKGTLSLVDGTANTLNVGALTVGGTGSATSFLDFEIGAPGVSDKIIANTFTAGVGGTVLNFSQLDGTVPAAGSYSLIGYTNPPSGTSGLQVGAVPDAPAGQVGSYKLSHTNLETRLNVVFAAASSNHTAYWTGAVGTQWNDVTGPLTNFSENANGSGAVNILPDATTDVHFTAISNGGNAGTTLGQDFSIRSLHFAGTGSSAATTSHSIGGLSLLTIGSGGLTVDATSADHTISSRVSLGTAQTWNLAGTANQKFTVSGAISGADLTVNGGRTLVLSGANNYGETIINSNAAVQIGDGGTTGSLGSGGVTNNGTLIFSRTNTATVSNAISGTGELIVNALNVITLTGDNTYTGPTRIGGGGSISVSSINSVVGGTASSGLGAPITVADGTISLGDGTQTGSLRYSGAGEITDRVINLAGTTGNTAIYQNGTGLLKFTSDLTTTGIGNKNISLRGTGSGEGEFAGVIGNTGDNTGVTSLTKTDSGFWTLSGANTYTGSTTVSVGTLRLAGAGRISTGDLIMSSGTTVAQLDLNGTNQTVAGLSGTSPSGTILNNSATTASTLTIGNGTGGGTYSGTFADGTSTLAVTKIGTGTITLAGTVANSHTGLTTVSSGGLALNKTDVNAIAGDVLIDGGYLIFSKHNQIADTAAVTVTAGGFNTTGEVNTGALSAIKETIGSLTVSNTGIYNQTGASSNVTVTGAASFTGGNGAIFFLGSGGSFSSESLTVADMSRTTGTGSANNSGSTNGFLVYGNNAIQSVVTVGSGGLTMSATTNLGNNIVLRGGNTADTPKGSKLALDGDVTTTGSFASAIIRDTNPSLLTAPTIVELSATGTGTVTRTFNIGGGGADLTIGANVVVTNGAASSAGLTKTGSGTLTLNGENTYTGTTTVNDGRLRVGGGINSSTQISVNGATLELMTRDVLANDASLTLNNSNLIARGVTETLGTLAIIGDSQLDLVAVGNAVFFSDSSATSWSGNLAILNWAAQTFGGTGNNQLLFGTDANGLDEAEQVSRITFVNPTIGGVIQTGTYGATILASGEVVAVIPETTSALLVLLGAGALIGRRRR
jgi:autotransporter-associated beta strand protein